MASTRPSIVWLAAEREHLQDRARSLGEVLLREQVDPEGMIPVAQRLLGHRPCA